MTAGKAGFGLIGGLAMISAGNKIVKDHQIEDPANLIRQELISALVAQRGLTLIETKDIVAESGDAKVLASKYKQADTLLDVQTINWSFGYFATDWNNYRVVYSVKLRMIDTRSGKMLAEGFCSRIPEKSADAPNYEQLLANDAERLKSELHKSAESCLGELKTNALKL